MLATVFKGVVGFLPVGVTAYLAQAVGTQEPGIIVAGGAFGTAGFYFSLWLKEKKSHSETWKEIERIRAERDRARTHCANCPGNEIRRTAEKSTTSFENV